jgi:GLPGLI family protein
MKFSLIIIFLLLQSFVAKSQVSGIITYDFIMNSDPKKMIVHFNDTSSLCTYNKTGLDSSFSSKKDFIRNDSLGLAIKVSRYDSVGQQVYLNFKSKRIKLRQTKVGVLDEFTVGDLWAPIDWKIYPKINKVINGYLCNKAMGYFRGRLYTAWYTTDIVGGYGPWKLYGLPGLIMEAYDIDESVYFIASNIVLVDSVINIKEPLEAKNMSMKEYIQYLDDPSDLIVAKVNAKLPQGMRMGKAIKKTPIKVIRSRSLEVKYEWEEKKNKNLLEKELNEIKIIKNKN